MTYCYTPMESPDFFGGVGDCVTIGHDLEAKNGGLAGGNSLISAILIQMNTDANSNGERGWWGDQFEKSPIGNLIWTITGRPASEDGLAAKMDEYVRTALRALSASGLIRRLDVESVRTIDGLQTSVQIALPREGVAVVNLLA